MKMLNRKKIVIMLSITVLLLMTFAPMAGLYIQATAHQEAVNIIQEQKKTNLVQNPSKLPYTFSQKILILYDGQNEVIESASLQLYQLLALLYQPVELKSVDNRYQFLSEIDSTDAWIIIYIFNTTLDSMTIGTTSLSWNDFARLLIAERGMDHILVMGNTRQLSYNLRFVPENVHFSVQDIVDLDVGILYGYWTVADILDSAGDDFKDVALDMRRIGLKLFADNFNELFTKTIDPQIQLGEEDLVAKRENFEKNVMSKFKRGAYILPPLPPGSHEFPNYTAPQPEGAYSVTDLPVNLSDLKIALLNPEDVESTGAFPLIEFPFLSGLDGPIGKIVDLIFETILGSGLGSVLAIPGEVVSKITAVFNVLQQIVGFITSGDITSLIYTVLENLKDAFPSMAGYADLVNLIFTAFSAFRGNSSAILDVVMQLLDYMFPDLGATVQQLKDLVLGLLDIGNNLDDFLSDKDKMYCALTDWFSSKTFESLVNYFLNDTLNLPQSKIDTISSKIIETIKSGINLATTHNATSFINFFKDTVIKNTFNILNDAVGESTLNKIMSLMDLAFSLAGFTDKGLKEPLVQLLKEFLNETSFSDGLNGIKSTVDAIIDLVDDFIEKKETSVADFKAQARSIIEDALVNSGVISPELKSLVVDIIAMVGGVLNGNFSVADLPKLNELLPNALSILLPDSYSSGGFNKTEIINMVNTTLSTITSLTALVTDNMNLLKQFIGDIEYFKSLFSNPDKLLHETLDFLFKNFLPDDYDSIANYLGIGSEAFGVIIKIVKGVQDNNYQGIFLSILDAGVFALLKHYGITDIGNFTTIVNTLIPNLMGLDDVPSPKEAINMIIDVIGVVDPGLQDEIKSILSVFIDIGKIFQDGIKWIFSKLMTWLLGQVEDLIKELPSKLNDSVGGFGLFAIGGDNGLSLADLTGVDIHFNMGFDLNFDLDEDAFSEFITDMVFDGLTLDLTAPLKAIPKLLTFMEITPVLFAELSVNDLGSGNEFLQYLLGSFGMEWSFSGSAAFKIQLFSFKGGSFDFSEFLKLIEWSLYFNLEVTKQFTLLDLFTAGAGGSALSKLAEYIGLDTITLDIYFGVMLEIVKSTDSIIGAIFPTMTLELTVGAALSLSLDIVIASLSFYGSIEVVFTFVQDLLHSPPLQIMLDIVAHVKVTLGFLFWDLDLEWGPKTLASFSFNAGSVSDSKTYALGFDTDGDGLTDDYELKIPGLMVNSSDTDGDGLTDKEELFATHTDPTRPDTDGDGLNDFDEVNVYLTNTKLTDTDFDGLDDYIEVTYYNTDPLSMDTDEDGLDDYFEINHVWDISNVTPSVDRVLIGDKYYNDRTDPLNPDTDNDGLLDGQEGEFGPFYGDTSLYNESDPSVSDVQLIFNYGYTHPLDNDTDDDSYLQLRNGSLAKVNQKYVFLRSMTDGEEVKGISVTFIINGTPELRVIKTNPCNPDTDGDTGNLAWGPVGIDEYMMSDGYELSLDPPSDPLDGDSDDDGLIDGLEGTLRQDSNHTHYLNPDTDNDGLGDLEDTLLGTDPRNPDTDFDMVSDGEEYYKYGTDPRLADTDGDGLLDGEEIYIWHTNPMLRDSDRDGLSDSEEVYVTYTNPMDEDTDNDGLTDFQEFFYFGTDPFDYDTDDDGLWDGFEINVSRTDPLNWDTDGDSILYPNENGTMTWPMSDGFEVNVYHTNPLVSDTDKDGLSDAIELYLGSGRIPTIDPIPLDPLNNDTDGDSLLDGQELRIANISDIIYPYVAFVPTLIYGSSPVLNDTDSDGLDDFFEVNVTRSSPNNTDTDNDTIPDGVEYFTYHTDPAKNDTDGDGLTDAEEIGYNATGSMFAVQENSIFLRMRATGTDPLDPDSDDDLLPDGYEVSNGLDPLVSDENGNGILDGYERDTDNDGLSDGEEFYVYNTTLYPGGGFMNPDSDNDGLSDGVEVHVYGTSPINPDTDNDTYSDGLEVAVGTDPLTWTSPEEFEAALAKLMIAAYSIKIFSPTNATISDRTVDVRVINSTTITKMWFVYSNSTYTSGNISMAYDSHAQHWYNSDIIWSETSYHIVVYGLTTNGTILTDEVWFTISPTGASTTTMVLVTAVAIVGAAAGTVMVTLFLLRRKGYDLFSMLRGKTPKGGTGGSPSGTKVLMRKLRKLKRLKRLGKGMVLKVLSKRFRLSFVSGLFLLIFLVSSFGVVSYMTPTTNTTMATNKGSFGTALSSGITNSNFNEFSTADFNWPQGKYYPADMDYTQYLFNNPNEYHKVWEPWLSKAALHTIAFSDDQEFMAVAGGYLQDNEIHIYRWNPEIEDYVHVWDAGDGIIQGDIVAMDFGDTDNNHFIEIAAASADGHIYVFEQKHIYDPVTNTENEFELVWTSPKLARVWDLKLEDADLDGRVDIIASCWDKKVHVFEYIHHSGYPFSESHWIEYEEVWTSPVLDSEGYSVVVADTNYNGLPEIIVGTRNGTIYIFENNGTVLMINGYPFPLTNDNNYALNWTSSGYTWMPITYMKAGDLDGNPGDELALLSQGLGVFVLDYSSTEGYKLHKLLRPLESWEKGAGPSGAGHPLDIWVDLMTYGQNVWYVDASGTWVEPNSSEYRDIAPRNTAMAAAPDGKYSHMNSTADNESIAILDFGKDEEVTGNANEGADILVTFIKANGFQQSPDFSHLVFAVSPDGVDFENISSADLSYTSTSSEFYVSINVDNVLAARHWRYIRYIKVTVTGGQKYAIDAFEVKSLYRPVDTATALTIGAFRLDGTNTIRRWYAYYFAAQTNGDIDYWLNYFHYYVEKDRIIIGTVDGRLIVFGYNSTSGGYSLYWDSYTNENYALNTNIWTLEELTRPGKLPTFIKLSPASGFSFMSAIPGEEFTRMEILDLDGDKQLEYIVGTKQHRLELFESLGASGYNSTHTSELFDGVNTFSDYANCWIAASFANLTGNEMLDLIVTAVDPSTLPTGSPGSWGYDTYVKVYIDIWTYSNLSNSYGTSPYRRIATSEEDFDVYEKSGMFSDILRYSTTLPMIDFGDFDNDGDLDAVVTNGKVYLLENIGNSVDPKFYLDADYFANINDAMASRILENPRVVNFDLDGDLDIVLSFHNRLGATYYVNDGTNENPKWIERPNLFRNSDPNGDFAYNNLTTPVFARYIPYDEPLEGATGTPYLLYAYNNYTQGMATMFVDTIYPSNYIIGTNPYLHRMAFAYTKEGTYATRGYHILEVWNNKDELNNWTLAVGFADLDNDGNNEVIVGDYDNNLYVFEHMTNNTYKRAFRSFDFNHSIETSLSPYAWEEFEGISGTFYRKFWDHVTHLTVGSDLDGDGLREIIAATELNLYVFESTGVDDTYSLIWQYDLRNSYWYTLYYTLYNKSLTEITALAYADDLDYNYRGEIIVAVNNLLLVFESDGANGFVEVFMGNSTNGLYNVVGNPFFGFPNNTYENLTINTIAVSDTDNNGYYEIILGGSNTSTPCHPSNGFVAILENHLGTYHTIWLIHAENIYEVYAFGKEFSMLRNPVNIIRIDDQDHDGNKEILVGHQFGVDIWEYNASYTKKYQLVESISGYTMFPRPFVGYLFISPSGTGRPDYSFEAPSNDILYSGQGVFEVFTAKWVEGTMVKQSMFWRRSTDDGSTWSNPTPTRIFSDADYNTSLATPNVKNVTYELDPSLVELSNGEVWLAWRAKVGTTSGTYEYNVYLSKWTGSSWTAPYRVIYSITESSSRVSIRLFQTMDSTYNLGLAYRFLSDGRVYIRTYDTSSFTGSSMSYHYIGGVPYIGDSSTFEFETKYFDIILLDNNKYFLVFDGKRKSEGKTEYDLWGMFGNSTWDWEYPIRVVSTSKDESMPSITQSKTSDHAIIVSYQVLEPGESFVPYVVTSRTEGRTWSPPEKMFVDFFPVFPICYNGTARFKYIYSGGEGLVLKMTYLAPAISARPDGGFVYTTQSKIVFVSWNDQIPSFGFLHSKMSFTYKEILMFGIRRDSNWTMYLTSPVTALATGDTDRDGREEIFTNYHENGVTAFEIQNSINDWQYHAQVWFSDEFSNTITELSVGDGNGNGWPELQIASERGDVFVYEVPDLNMSTTNLFLVPFRLRFRNVGTSSDAVYGPVLADFNGDGSLELAAVAWNGTDHFIYMLSSELDILWAKTTDFQTVLVPVDIDGDNISELLATTSAGTIELLKGNTGAPLWSITSPFGQSPKVAISKTNSQVAYLGSSSGVVYALNLTDHTILWNTSLAHTIYGISIITLDTNSTEGLAALNSIGELYILDVQTGDILKNTTLLGNRLATGDLDNDGISEYVVAGNYNLVILDDDLTVLKNLTFPYISSQWVRVVNIDNSGSPEIVVNFRNSTTSCYITVLTSLGVKKWGQIIQGLVPTFDLIDINNDTIVDFVFPLYNRPAIVVDGLTGGIYEVIIHSQLKSYSVVTGDSNGDGVPEIFITGFNNMIHKFGYNLLGKTYRADVTTSDYFKTFPNILNGNNAEILVMDDITHDSKDDIILAGGERLIGIASYGDILFNVSLGYSIKSVLVWRETATTVSIAVSLDGKGIVSYAFNGTSLTEEWFYLDGTYTAYDMDVYLFGSDTYIAAAMVRGASAGGVYIIDSTGNLKNSIVIGVPVLAVEVHEFSSSYAGPEIVAYTDNKYLYFYSFDLTQFYSYTSKRVNTFSCEDLNGDGYIDVAVGTDDSVVALSPETTSQLWAYSTSGNVNSVVTAKLFQGIIVNVAAEIENREIIVLSNSGAKTYSFDAPNLVMAPNTQSFRPTFLYNADINNDGYQDIIAISGNRLYALTIVNSKLDAVWATNFYSNLSVVALGNVGDPVFTVADTIGNVYQFSPSQIVDVPPAFTPYPGGYGDFSAASIEDDNATNIFLLLLLIASVVSLTAVPLILMTLKKKSEKQL